MSPPRLARKFLSAFLREDLREEVLGDLDEQFEKNNKTGSRFKARIVYWSQTLNYLRPFALRKSNTYTMMRNDLFQNYLKTGVRNIIRYKAFSAINIFGLSLSMSVCMLILLMLADQHRYDQFNVRKDRIYRILSNYGNSRQGYATSPFPLAAVLKSDYPVVEEATHLTPGFGGDAAYGQKLVELRGYFAAPEFLRIFSFELAEGNPSSALTAPNSIILSRAKAFELFGDENALGKRVEFSDRHLPFPLDFDGVGSPPVPWGSFLVTGIIDESRYPSHLKFDVLASSSTLPSLYAEGKMPDRSNDWRYFYRGYTYVLLEEGKTASELNAALNDLVSRKQPEMKSEEIHDFRFDPQPLADVQLGLMGNDTNNRMPLMGYYFLGGLALAIMLSAALNYTNLSIARALTRAREIGIRKVTGANRWALVTQFLSESILVSLCAMIAAIGLLVLIKPAFKSLWINQHLNFELPQSVSIYLLFIGFAVLVGVIAGLYPAFHLSAYRPVAVLKNFQFMKPGKLGIRKMMSITQFVVSLFFIVTSILIFNQFRHFMYFDYGFKSEGVINVELQGADYLKAANAFSTVPGVAAVSACDIIPAKGTNNGIEIRKSNTDSEYTRGDIINADPYFADNLDIQLIAGRPLPAEAADGRFILLNELAVNQLGYHSPAEAVGQTFESKWSHEILECVGVVKDFQYLALINTNPLRPLVLRFKPDKFQYLNVRIASPQPMLTIEKIGEKWKQIDPVHPLQYRFFEEELQMTQMAFLDLVTIIGFIAFLAIVIACLGMLGMATYSAERKTKEVGIRKVLGAGMWNISLLLSREFILVLLLSIIIGTPLSYFVNNLWLLKFPVRVDFGAETLLPGIGILFVTGLFTIGSQTIRASRRNPADALKME